MASKLKLLCVVAAVIYGLLVAGALTYFVINTIQGLHCKVGHYPCFNSSQCVSQMSICDGHGNCPANDDEDQCFDKGRFTWAILKEPKSQNVLKPPPMKTWNCSLSKFPANCTCVLELLRCNYSGLSRIPIGVKGKFKKLSFLNNNMRVLHSDSFTNYTDLITIRLSGNGIEKIQPFTFLGLDTLLKLDLGDNRLTTLESDTFDGLNSLTDLILSDNNLHNFNLSAFNMLINLNELFLSNNKLTLDNLFFPPLANLASLHISENKIRTIAANHFNSLVSLRLLDLDSNEIQLIDPNAFKHLTHLSYLKLSNNRIKHLHNEIFQSLTVLVDLYITNNPLTNFNPRHVKHLSQLIKLELKGITVVNISIEMYTYMPKLSEVYFKTFKYCRYFPYVRVCRPNTDGLSSREHLLSHQGQRVAVWTFSIAAILLNARVIYHQQSLYRKNKNKLQESKQLPLFMINVAAADLVMGIYLLLIAIVDAIYSGQYFRFADSWMSSLPCLLIGMLAVISSEASIIILTLRMKFVYTKVKNPFNNSSENGMFWGAIASWTIVIVLAVVPIFVWSDNNEFYGSNGMCYPVHINSPFEPGWQYTTFIVVGINSLCILINVVGYSKLMHFLKGSKVENQYPKEKSLAIINIRVMLIIVTNCVCCIPVIVTKCVAMADYEISPEWHLWVVACFIPINSVLNPIIYTISLFETFINQWRCFFHLDDHSSESTRGTKLAVSSIRWNVCHRSPATKQPSKASKVNCREDEEEEATQETGLSNISPQKTSIIIICTDEYDTPTKKQLNSQ